MNIFWYFLIISNAAKKNDYNHGLAITLSLIFKILGSHWLTNQKSCFENLLKLLQADERIQRDDVEARDSRIGHLASYILNVQS